MSSKRYVSRTRRERFMRFGVGILFCCVLLMVYSWQPSLLQQADRNLYDVFLRHNGGGVPSPTPALIDIDERSLATFGQWPWPRHLLGKLVALLTENGAAAIALDILLAEPDNASVKQLQASFRQHFNLELPIDSIPQALHDNDRILATLLAQTPTVLSAYVRFTGQERPLPESMPPQEGLAELTTPTGIAPRDRLQTGRSVIVPLLELRETAPLGIMNVAPDPDGIIRSVPLLVNVDGRIMISLGLRALMLGLRENTLVLVGGEDGLQALGVGKYMIPVRPDGTLMVAFRGGRKSYPTFSAADILNNVVPRHELEGRIFIVGTSAAGLLDIRATPFDAVYPGAEVHATIIDNILSRHFMEIPPWNSGIQRIMICLVGGLGTILFGLAGPALYVPLFVAILISLLGSSQHFFQQGMYFSPLYGMLTLVLVMLSLLGVRFWQEARQKRTLHSAFSRYIAPDMVARIMDRGEVVLMGEEREVSLLFTDIRSFTGLSEKLTPNQVVSVLNRYFTPMTAIIREHQGTMDKFIGDAVMAFWNAPLDVAHHPLRAIQSALQMHTALDVLNKDLHREFGIFLRIGAGVHTGKVYVGNMGSAELLDYTCIGDNVNLAARLEGLCAVYGVGVITSAETAVQCRHCAVAMQSEHENMHQQGFKQVKSIENQSVIQEKVPFFLPLDAIRVKGKTLPVEICTPMPFAEKMAREGEIQAFLAAREAYTAGDFTHALKAFLLLQAEFPQVIVYDLYVQRSQQLCETPPVQWDGVWTFTQK